MPTAGRPLLIVLVMAALVVSPLPAAAAPGSPAAAPALTPARTTPTELGDELLPPSDFTQSVDPWWTTPNTTAVLVDGALCVEVPGTGGDPWSTIVGVDGIPWQEGENYHLTFRASGTEARTIRVLAQMDKAPWTATYELNPTMTSAPADYAAVFTSTLDWPQGGQLVFQIGGSKTPWTFCLDEVSLRTGPPPDEFVHEVNSAVRVNQHGYRATGPKRATVLSDAETPQPWEVRDSGGAVLARGETEVFGRDESVAAGVHRVDFSELRTTGAGFTLVVGEETSYPFSVSNDLYGDLARDAMRYFLLARSGIALEADTAGAEYARPAGHLDVAPNRGDTAVGCQQPRWWYSDWTCDRTFAVQGGWYDAGDHGKYVVNGGIAVHQLLDVWERAERAGAGALFGDGTLNLPESGAGVPDVLSEARWELEWMLRMRVPDDMLYGGLYFHKVQDDGWTGLPLMPWLDDRPRQVHRPSTAATLNVAAAAAKGARLFTAYDPAFAEALREAAEDAWQAALAYPDRIAVNRDGNEGGGPYDDDVLDDEFFWAAAELALTTGDDTYIEALSTNPLTEKPGVIAPFGWKDVATLGLIDLAMVDSDLTAREPAREALVVAAEKLLAEGEATAFGHLYVPAGGRYEWGSNSLVLNSLVVVATAYDITGEQRFRDAVFEGMDYLFGRNGVDLSYITGYGTSYAHNQHHRWMAPSLDATLPPIPAGTVAGGPNSSIQDPVAQRMWPNGCPGQLCYLDDIQAWSTNEMTINWNSALSWVAAWLAAEEAAEAKDAAVPAWIWWTAGGVGAAIAAGLGVFAWCRRARPQVEVRPAG